MKIGIIWLKKDLVVGFSNDCDELWGIPLII
jgi:hypothetical protein